MKNPKMKVKTPARHAGAVLLAAGLAIIPVACGTDDSSNDNSDDDSSGLTEAFSENCASCHGDRGGGTSSGRRLLGYENGVDRFRNQVRNGGGSMPAFETSEYSEEDLLTDYTWLISNE